MRIPRLRQLCILALVLMSIVSIAPGQNNSGKFIVGVLQESGAIIPFARYDGARWVNTWPAPVDPSQNRTPPVVPALREWLGENAPASWRLWLPNGTTHAIRATGSEYLKDTCGTNWVLSTDFPKTLNPRPFTCPLRTIGIVFSTDQKLIPFYPGNHSGIALSALEKAGEAAEIGQMRDENEARARLGTRERASFGPDWDVTSRARFPLKVERTWSAETDNGDVFSYLEANRRFDLESSKECARFSVFHGWVADNAKVLKSNVVLTDCDFKEAEFITPMGLVDLKGGLFAIIQVNGWEGQAYAILKIGPTEVTTVLDSPVR